MLFVDITDTLPTLSGRTVHINGISMAVNKLVSFAEEYQLSNVKLSIQPSAWRTKSATTLMVRSVPGVPPIPFAPEVQKSYSYDTTGGHPEGTCAQNCHFLPPRPLNTLAHFGPNLQTHTHTHTHNHIFAIGYNSHKIVWDVSITGLAQLVQLPFLSKCI